MDWGIIIAFGALMFVVLGEILRAHMLIRRLERRVKKLEKQSNQDHTTNKISDTS